VRLQAVLLPDAMQGGRRHAKFFGQAPRALVGSRLRLAQGGAHHGLFLYRADPPWTPSARPGLPARMTHDYTRHGTTSLLHYRRVRRNSPRPLTGHR
jgi:hypothetical protein